MKSIINPSLVEKLNDNGWTVGDDYELSLTHEDGSVATKQAALIIARHFAPDLMAEQDSDTPESSQMRAFAKACAASEVAAEYIENATNHDIEHGKDSSTVWKTAFDLVFTEQVSGAAHEALAELNAQLDYYSPDTSYEEDVCAFASALSDKIKELRTIMAPSVQGRRSFANR